MSEQPSSYITPHFDDGGRVMVTNNGPHPADLWSQATAEHIAPIAKDMTGRRRIAAQALQGKILEALIPHYDKAQSRERDNLSADPEHLVSAIDPSEYVNAALAAVQDASKGTEWEAHFQNADVIAEIKSALATHFNTAHHIERSWHVDRNPDHPLAATFRGRA